MRNHECGRGGRGFGPMGWKMAKMMAMSQGGRGGGWGWGEDWSGGDFAGGRGRQRRGRGRMFAGGELRLVLLRLIADGSRHGYELIKAIEELTGGEYAPSPGVVYPTLSLLVDEGMIAEADSTDEGTSPRKAFAVTDKGMSELADHEDEVAALIDRLKSLGEDRAQHASPPIRRAIANLFTALAQRRMTGAIDAESAHRIAEILDDAARQIERL